MKHLTASPTPRDLGFAMPPEWAPHAATWMSWPFDDALWFGHLERVRREFADLVRAIAAHERVELLVTDAESERDARARLEGADVRYHQVPLDDVWLRDNGPLFVTRNGELSFVNWTFNAWGGKFSWLRDDRVPEVLATELGAAHWDVPVVLEGGSLDLGGDGTALTTRSCLLSQERNPDLGEAGYAALLGAYLGVGRLLWLDGGLEGDHTDGHIDTLTRFVSEGTIVTSVAQNRGDPNFETLRGNLERLRGFTDAGGQPYEIVELPLPQQREGPEGPLAASYANFYIGNGFVVVPQYGDPNDARALAVLTPLFPGRTVLGRMSRELIIGGGSFHCVTQQQPVGQIWKGEDLD